MTYTAIFQGESSPTSKTSWTTGNPTPSERDFVTTEPKLLTFKTAEQRSEKSLRHQAFNNLLKETEESQEGRALMARSRQVIGGHYYPAAKASVKAARLSAGLSQSQLAKIIGTSQPHIANIENGRTALMLETAGRIAKALGLTLDEVHDMFCKS